MDDENNVDSVAPLSTLVCKNCGSLDIETNTAEGNAFCSNCGTVLEENAIVSEITFGEASNGASVLQGQFVSADRGYRMGSATLGGGRRLNPNESREITIANGRRRIQALAAAVRLSEKFIDMAHRWYVLALQQNFTQGRKANNVSAACLYIVCRQEKTPHMLLDFAEILRVSVYSLGNTFLKLSRLLNLELPLLDPSLFIGRFASKLNLGEETRAIANTALRLVSRMKRDWIQTGRRPSGICGAALIIACHMFGQERSRLDIMKVVKVCDATLRKRLEEFSRTETASLSCEDFKNGIWLESEADPPSFTASRVKGPESSASTSTSTSTSAANNNSNGLVGKKRRRAKSTKLDTSAELQRQIRQFIDANQMTDDANVASTSTPTRVKTYSDSGAEGEDDSEVELSALEDEEDESSIPEQQLQVVEAPSSNLAADDECEGEGSREPPPTPLSAEEPATTEAASFSDLDDDHEINGSLLAPHEVEIKTRVWTELNQEYLDYIAQHPEKLNPSEKDSSKKKKRGGKKANGAGGSGASSNLENQSNEAAGNNEEPTSALDSAKRMIQTKKFSKRINYLVLESLFTSNNASGSGSGNGASSSGVKEKLPVISEDVPLISEAEVAEESVEKLPSSINHSINPSINPIVDSQIEMMEISQGQPSTSPMMAPDSGIVKESAADTALTGDDDEEEFYEEEDEEDELVSSARRTMFSTFEDEYDEEVYDEYD